MEFQLLKRIVEAALMAAPQPLAVPQLIDLFNEGEAPPADEIRRALLALQEDCAERGVELVEIASGFRYQVRTDIHPHLARLWAEKPARYSRALLETLALIAYRQPITRGEIEAIRGVAVNSQIIRTLEEREWIRVVGHRDVPGKPALFGTTRAFLDYFNLKSLDQLPPLSALQDITDLEPQLDFEGGRAAVTIAVAAADEAHSDSEASEVDAPAPAESTASPADEAPSPASETPETADGEPQAGAPDPTLVPVAQDEAARPLRATSDPVPPTGEAETSPEPTP